MVVVGLGYKARSGKDTAVKHLIEAYQAQYDIRRYAFGDLLKAELYDAISDWRDPYWAVAPGNYLALPHPELSLIGKTVEEKVFWMDANRTPEVLRHLQFYGTEYRRAQNKFYWVRAMAERLAQDQPQIALISDMRFRNEMYFVKSLEGFTVKVTRYGYVLDDGRDPNHPGEIELDDATFDYEINVLDGEVEQLQRDAVTVMEMVIDIVNPIKQEVADGQLPVAA